AAAAETEATRGQTLPIGSLETLSLAEMLRRVAALEGRHRLVVPLPLALPRLSARWVSLVARVPPAAARRFVAEISQPADLDDRAARLLPRSLASFEEIWRATLPATDAQGRTVPAA